MTSTIPARLGLLVLGTVVSAQASAQVADGSLAADLATTQAEIRKAEEEEQKYTGGLVKTLISLRLATLKQTLAALDQRAKAGSAHTSLHYTVDGKAFVPPTDANAQIAALDNELAANAVKIAKQEAEVSKYSGGLVQATAMVTLATLRQSQAMLEQRRLALKYGLPQYVDSKGPSSSVARAEPEAAPARTTHTAVQASLPADCMKVVFASFCLGGPVSALPPNPAKKDDEKWIYTAPENTAVAIVDGRVAWVGRLHTPGTWLTYAKLLGDLSEKYGKGKDLSFFPSYANDQSSKETAISLKKGRAIHSWEQPGFTIQLKWENREHVGLIYYHDELQAKVAAKRKDQY